MKKEPKKEEGPRVKSTLYFKLKDRPTRQYKVVKLKELFGFLPEVIIVEKQWGSNNSMRVLVVLTPEEIEKEDKLKAIAIKKEKKVKNPLASK